MRRATIRGKTCYASTSITHLLLDNYAYVDTDSGAITMSMAKIEIPLPLTRLVNHSTQNYSCLSSCHSYRYRVNSDMDMKRRYRGFWLNKIFSS